MAPTPISQHYCFGGQQTRYQHRSDSLDCDMTFSLFLPEAVQQAPVPLIYWLSGLTCTDENFVQKAGAQRMAAQLGVAIVAPDTSPRGADVADDPDGSYDLGLGAGFYVNASEAPWSDHYQMYQYCSEELPRLLTDHLPVDTGRQSIMGHSMGGHGAMTLALKNPGQYRSVSAFAPICAPSQCAWGEKALGAYLGKDKDKWRAYDACALIEDGAQGLPMRVDFGGADEFLDNQLKPELLSQACQRRQLELELHQHPGYDHSYFFIASFMDEHLKFHAQHLLSDAP